MHLFVNLRGSKATVIFIQGFRKSHETWNVTETKTKIMIESTMAKQINTITIQFTDEDYVQSTTKVCEAINNSIDPITIPKTNITIVAHSQGCFYAIRLAELYPDIYTKLLLLDPVMRDAPYLEQIKGSALTAKPDSVEVAKFLLYDDLPDENCLRAKIIVRVHLNVETDNEYLMNRLEYFNKLTNRNDKSRIVVHLKVGHMIHYSIPHVVIEAIRELYWI